MAQAKKSRNLSASTLEEKSQESEKTKSPPVSPEPAYANPTSEERAELMAIYDQHPCRLPKVDSHCFTASLEGRIKTEWAEKCPDKDTALREYNGQGFASWLADEIHYELEHRGFFWDKPAGRFYASDKDPAQVYAEVKPLVLKAIVERGIDYFAKCRKDLTPRARDKGHLMQSLRGYLHPSPKESA